MRLQSLRLISLSALGLAAIPAYGSTIVYNAGTVQALDPGGTASNTVVDAGSNTTLPEGETLANFTTLVSNAYANNTGGVINFEEVDENGDFNDTTTTGQLTSPAFSWPSQTSTSNGTNLGNGQSNAVLVNYGASQPTGTTAYSNGSATNTTQLVAGPNSIIFWRDLYTANGGVPGGTSSTVKLGVTSGASNSTETNTADGFDANNGENNSANTGVTPTSGVSYLGFTNDGNPIVLDFSSDPLSAFGINVLDRNSTRPLTVYATLADGTVLQSSTQANAGASGDPDIFYGFDLTPADLSTHGGIIYTTFDTTTGSVDRFDDLAFVVAPVPEPASIGLVGVGALGLLRRRRRA